jgi:NAD(P)-dependent dehydrogenase (short-subunit alcohol dehydrogenase family)
MGKLNRGTALVTGGSTGIGLATARALRDAGYNVFGTSRRIGVPRADGITMLSCDVTDDASVQKVVADVVEQSGRIDILVNNAGVGLFAAAEESSIEQVQALFDVNFFGVVRMTNAVLPTMRRQGNGRIINMSSILGLIPAPYSALYSATKHAVEGYSESLDHEVRSYGIRVTLVEPAYTRTSFEENLTKPDAPLAVYDLMRSSVEVAVRDGLQRGDNPDVVAATVVSAATAPNPKRRHTAGAVARRIRLLRRFVPEAAFDMSLRKQMGLPA